MITLILTFTILQFSEVWSRVVWHLHCRSWRWRQEVPSEYWYLSTRLHDTAVINSTLTFTKLIMFPVSQCQREDGYFYLVDIGSMTLLKCRKTSTTGRAIAHAVSRQLPSSAARVRSQFKLRGICGGQSATTGASFLRALRFSLPIPIPS
jgi:uncharacterized membrane protein